jgi:hypothetical protein
MMQKPKPKVVIIATYHDMFKGKLAHKIPTETIFKKYSQEFSLQNTLIIFEDPSKIVKEKEKHSCKCGMCIVQSVHKLDILNEIFDSSSEVLEKVEADIVIADTRKLEKSKSKIYMDLCSKVVKEGHFLIKGVEKFLEVSRKNSKEIVTCLQQMERDGDIVINRDVMKKLYSEITTLKFNNFKKFLLREVVKVCDYDLVHAVKHYVGRTCQIHGSYETIFVVAGFLHVQNIQDNNLIPKKFNPVFDYNQIDLDFILEEQRRQMTQMGSESFSLTSLVFPSEILFNFIFK